MSSSDYLSAVLAAVVVVGRAMTTVPGFGWGWWSAVEGDGNPVFGSTAQTTGTPWEWSLPLESAAAPTAYNAVIIAAVAVAVAVSAVAGRLGSS